MGISVLIPTLWRVERAIFCFRKILDGMREDDELLIISDPTETEYFERSFRDERVKHITTDVTGYWRCMNFALPFCKNEVFCWTADDTNPHEGWLEIARMAFEKHFKNGKGVVAMNDFGSAGDQTCGHAISTRKFLHILFGTNGFFPDKFHHLYLDTLIADRAKALRRFVYCQDAIVEHMHHTLQKSQRDRLNIRNEAWYVVDKQTKDEMDKDWKNNGFFTAQVRMNE